jgi:hypothetical protein
MILVLQLEVSIIFNALDFPTIHATVEQSIVKYFLNLSFSQDGCFDIPCDKEKLCDDAYVVSVPHLMTEIDIVVSKTATCAENNIFVPIIVCMMSSNCYLP